MAGAYAFEEVTARFMHADAPRHGAELAPGYDLEEAVSAIDLLDPRMDRGMLRIGGRTLSEHRRHMLDCVLPASPMFRADTICADALCAPANQNTEDQRTADYAERGQRTEPIADEVLGLETNLDVLTDDVRLAIVGALWERMAAWMAGARASDCLLPLMALHNAERVACPLLRWMLRASLQAASLLAELVQRSGAVDRGDFDPRLHSLLPPTTPAAVLAGTLHEWAASLCARTRERHSPGVSGEALRIARLLRVLVAFHLDEPLGTVVAAGEIRHGQRALRFLAAPMLDGAFAPYAAPRSSKERAHVLSVWLLESPLMANAYGVGCVRPPWAPHADQHARERAAWPALHGLVVCALGGLSRASWEGPRGALAALPYLLAPCATDTPFGPVLRALAGSRLVMHRASCEARFRASSAAQQWEDTFEALAIAIHAPHRQRSLLARALPRWADRRTLPSPVRAALCAWYVALGFRLALYDEGERPEALSILHALSTRARSPALGRLSGSALRAHMLGVRLDESLRPCAAAKQRVAVRSDWATLGVPCAPHGVAGLLPLETSFSALSFGPRTDTHDPSGVLPALDMAAVERVRLVHRWGPVLRDALGIEPCILSCDRETGRSVAEAIAGEVARCVSSQHTLDTHALHDTAGRAADSPGHSARPSPALPDQEAVDAALSRAVLAATRAVLARAAGFALSDQEDGDACWPLNDGAFDTDESD